MRSFSYTLTLSTHSFQFIVKGGFYVLRYINVILNLMQHIYIYERMLI